MFQAKKILQNTLKFLKKLTFVDYLIIIIVLLGITILYKFFNPEQEWVDVLIIDENVPIYQAAALKVGDIEKNPNGKKIAEIIDTESYDTPEVSDPTVPQKTTKDVYIQAKLQVKINPRSKEYEYKNRIIKVGAPIELRFNQAQINGKLAGIGPDSKPKYESKILTLKLYDQWSWFADSIKIGSGEINENGQNIVEVISKEIIPAQITVDTASGEKVLRTDPLKVDIIFRLRVQAEKLNNEFIFRKDKRILVGELFSFNAGLTRIKDALISRID